MIKSIVSSNSTLEYSIFQSMQFMNTSDYKGDNMTQFHHYEEMLQLLDTYKAQHNKFLLNNETYEEICNRKFLISHSFDCDDSIGNKFGIILNDFITGNIFIICLNF